MFKRIKHYVRSARDHAASHLSMSSDAFIFTILGIVVILGPLFFIPMRGFPVSGSKGFLVLILGLAGLLVYGVETLRRGVITVPRKVVFAMLGLLVVAGIFGAGFSSGFSVSFFGYGFETTTWLFTVLFALFALFAYRTISSYQRMGMLYGGIMIVFSLLALFHIVRFFVGPAFGNFGVLGSSTATLIGSWSDLAVFAGIIAIFSAVTLELAGLRRSFKWVVGVIGFIALAMVFFMNIRAVWTVLGLVSLLCTLYIFSFAYWDTGVQAYKKEHRVPWYMLAVFAVSLLGIFFGGFANRLAGQYRDIAWNDVRPSMGLTMRVAGKSLAHNFAVGYGPNSFHEAWSLVRPPALSGNATRAADFTQGFGYVPTQLAVNGVLGAIAWLGFFIFVCWALIKKTRQGFTNSLDRYFSILIGVGVLYFSIMAWVYIPGTYLLILLAIFVGAYISLTSRDDDKASKVFSFIKDPRTSFFGILGVTALIVATLIGGYIGIRKMISFTHYVRGAALANAGNLPGAAEQFTAAAVLSSQDLYHQELTGLALNDANQIAAHSANISKETISKQTEQALGLALGHAQAATKVNPGDYKNWMLLGNVYRTMVVLQIPGAYDRALAAYQEAANRAPHDVTMRLSVAQLELASKNTAKALSIIVDSINEFPTASAYILRAQIQISQGHPDDAIESLKAALGLDSYNTDLVYQYGLLQFSQKNYRDAIPAFQRVITLNRGYAPAYVYLGVAYERSDDTVRASQVYDFIKKQFPNGAEAIERLKSGTAEVASPKVPDPVAPTPKKQ